MRRFYFVLLICLSFVTVQATENLRHPQKVRNVQKEKPHEMGSEIDVYFEYDLIKPLTLFIGEEFYLSNFLTPNAPLFDASYTSVGLNYKPHPRVSLIGAYEFQYLYNDNIRHRLKLMITPNLQLGDFYLSLRERFQMTYSMADQSYSWLLRSRLRVDYNIPSCPLSVYLYAEMHNPLEANPVCWYDMIGYGTGIDWLIDDHNVLGFFYEFSHSVDSYYHLLGVAYVLGFWK
jgi:hypothetical protein